MNRDGSSPRELAPGRVAESGEWFLSPPDQLFGGLRWSPDGAAIGAIVSIESRQGISVVNAAGGPLVDLWPRPGIAFDYAWSPDGKQAVVSVAPQSEPGYSGPVTSTLWAVNRDGSGARELAPGLDAFSGSWSTDGTRIVFVQAHHAAAREVMIVRPDGTGLRAITDASFHGSVAWNRVARPGRIR